MKKLAWIIALSLITCFANAQQSVLFKIKYLPNRIYKMAMKMDMDMSMAVPGPATKKVKGKKAEPAKPMVTKAATYIQTILKSGNARADNTLPVTIEFTSFASKTKMNGKETNVNTNPFLGQVIYGRCDADGKMQVDSVKGGSATDETKKVLADMVNKMQAQVKFPEKAMSVGETFTQDMPMAIPAMGLNMKMNSKTAYKLTAIKGNLAYFDTNLNMNFGIDGTKNVGKTTGSGGGKGSLIYNIVENTCTVMNSTMNMKYTMTMGDKTMPVNMSIKTEVLNDISNK